MRKALSAAIVGAAVLAMAIVGTFALDSFNEIVAEAMQPSRWGAGFR